MYTYIVKKYVTIIIGINLLFSAVIPVFSQKIDLDQVDALDNLRMGIVSFHSGEFNKAILSLEKSLSFKPDWEVTRLWLGNAYFKAGFTDQALSYWKNILAKGGGSTTLKVRVDNLLYRRNMGPLLKGNSRYVTYHEIKGITADYTLFSRPGSLVPDDDGGIYVTSFGSNEVLRISANGVKTLTISGGIQGIDHPMDIIKTDTYLFFSAYGSDQIIRTNFKGGEILRFGSSGTGPGQFLGPQYITSDSSGYIYVTDEGNKRISKFTDDGTYVFSFGEKRGSFNGLLEPTGIAYSNNTLLVADRQKAVLYLFDKSGNYLRSFSSPKLTSPEGISSLPDGRFLLSDSSRVLVFDMANETFRVVTDTGDKQSLILKTVQDANGNLVYTDFNRDKLSYLADITRMYTGLDVSIDRVVSRSFPQVEVELTVSTIDGTPLVGLEDNNFLVTENSIPVPDAELVYIGNKSSVTNFSFLVEGSDSMKGKSEIRVDALDDVLKAQKGNGKVNIITAENVPVVESESTSNQKILRKSVISDGGYSKDWAFDLGVKLAASKLIQESDRRAVVFLTRGKVNESSFEHYTLNEILEYLINNHITFYTVYTGKKDDVSPELGYLCRKTGGKMYQLYRPAGVGQIVMDLKKKHSGTYVLKYTTGRGSDFGRESLPVEVQVSLFGRSGRGESLYYAPLR